MILSIKREQESKYAIKELKIKQIMAGRTNLEEVLREPRR